MKVLYISSLSSKFSDLNSSYVHRLIVFKDALDKQGVITRFLAIGDHFFCRPAIFSPLAIPFYLKFLRQFDIIHAGGSGGAYFLSIAKPFLHPNTKIIYDVHGDSIEEARLFNSPSFSIRGIAMFWQSVIMELFSRKKSDYFIVCSNVLYSHFLHYGINKSRLIVLPNGVNIHSFRPLSTPSNRSHFFTVAYAGHFQKWQGIELLLQATQLLANEQILLKLIGFNEDDLALKKMIKGKLGDKVELIDSLDRSQLNKCLSQADVLIIPRIKHPALDVAFPTKFGEYLATGLPIITTNVGEIAKLVNLYDCGFVCAPSPQDLANAIIKAKRTSPQQLSALGQNARLLAEQRLNITAIQNEYCSFITKIYHP